MAQRRPAATCHNGLYHCAALAHGDKQKAAGETLMPKRPAQSDHPESGARNHLQYDARDKYQSLVWGWRMTAQSTQIATPLSGEPRSKLRQVVRDSLHTLQLPAASRVPGDVIK